MSGRAGVGRRPRFTFRIIFFEKQKKKKKKKKKTPIMLLGVFLVNLILQDVWCSIIKPMESMMYTSVVMIVSILEELTSKIVPGCPPQSAEVL